MKKLALLGAGGHARVIADMALISEWSSVSFFDDAWPDKSKNGEWDVAGNISMLIENISNFDGVIVAIGDCDTRCKMQEQLVKADAPLVTIIHPSACVSPRANLGAGIAVMANAVVNAFASLGDGCVVNTGAIVEHDCCIGDFVHIAPGAIVLGAVTVGNGTWIGAGSTVRQGETIGKNAMVGAGSVVVKPVADGLTVVGCPASPLAKG